jgi:hypothetical protein
LASVEVKNDAFGVFSLKRIVLSSTFSMLAMFATNGLYIGDLSPAGASNEKITSSIVTGLPSCQVCPDRSFASTVVGSTKVTLSADHGFGNPSGPTRIRRSHTRSVTQLSIAPEMYRGLTALSASAAFSTMSFWAPAGVAPVKVQKLRTPMPDWSTMVSFFQMFDE